MLVFGIVSGKTHSPKPRTGQAPSCMLRPRRARQEENPEASRAKRKHWLQGTYLLGGAGTRSVAGRTHDSIASRNSEIFAVSGYDIISGNHRCAELRRLGNAGGTDACSNEYPEAPFHNDVRLEGVSVGQVSQTSDRACTKGLPQKGEDDGFWLLGKPTSLLTPDLNDLLRSAFEPHAVDLTSCVARAPPRINSVASPNTDCAESQYNPCRERPLMAIPDTDSE